VIGTLPVSGSSFVVADLTGSDELFVLESGGPSITMLLALLGRVVAVPTDMSALPAADLGAAALLARRQWLGDRIRTFDRCPAPACGEQIDVSFGVTDYVAHHAPRRRRGVLVGEGGWFAFATGGGPRFRIPTVGDLVTALGSPDPDATLSRLCTDPLELDGRARRRVDLALGALAPSLRDLVQGSCPGCGRQLTRQFDPISYVLTELADHCRRLYADIHLLASGYGWTEEAIIALPRSRRTRYVAMVADERAVL
jgi:hypothetical protein